MFERAVGGIRSFFAKRRKRLRGGRARDQLLRICSGDEARANRLVAAELARAPGISEAEAYRRAVESYQADNQ